MQTIRPVFVQGRFPKAGVYRIGAENVEMTCQKLLPKIVVFFGNYFPFPSIQNANSGHRRGKYPLARVYPPELGAAPSGYEYEYLDGIVVDEYHGTVDDEYTQGTRSTTSTFSEYIDG